MKIGIGLPNAVPGTEGEELVEFARRAEVCGFTSLGTIDRIVYGNYEPLVALSAAAAATERIGLVTSALLAPLRTNVALLAKQTLSVNELSGGRLTLGVALGARGDDYEISGVPEAGRGRRIDEVLAKLKELWSGDDIGPSSHGAPELVVGGHVEASFERAARFGAGWIAGGAPPDQYAEMIDGVNAAWSAAGRDGSPRTMGLAYFSLGDDAADAAHSYLTDYYAFLGDETAEMIAESAATDPETVKQYAEAFEGAGCGELILFPSSPDPEQVDLLAETVGLEPGVAA